MGKQNCCISNCKNNWRNSPNLKFHSLPEDPKVRSQYIKLIRNESLKVFSSNTEADVINFLRFFLGIKSHQNAVK